MATDVKYNPLNVLNYPTIYELVILVMGFT